MITNPVTCGPEPRSRTSTAGARYRISGVPVTDAGGVLLGMVTNRDIRFESDHARKVAEVMTPMPLVTGASASAATRRSAAGPDKIEKLRSSTPSGKLCGLITVKDFTKTEKFPHRHQGRRGPAGGRRRGRRRRGRQARAQALAEAGVDFLIVDTAHGHASPCSTWCAQ